MRIWSLHPKYLDSKGLVALWRETLLAQAVLLGNTKGYKNHPQLNRFKSHDTAIGAISKYLAAIVTEAKSRGYKFNESKIYQHVGQVSRIPVTSGQLAYEFKHLKNKLQQRDPGKLSSISDVDCPDIHDLFYVVDGDIESWEIISIKD